MTGGSGTASISQALSVNAKLTHMNLDCNRIGESGVNSSAHALSVNTSLAHLILKEKDIGLADDAFP